MRLLPLLATTLLITTPIYAQGIVPTSEKPTPNDVKIDSSRLAKASTASAMIVGADQLLAAKPARIAIVYDVPNQRLPQIVLLPADAEWEELSDLAIKIINKRKADAEKQLKDLGITLEEAPKNQED